MESKASVKNAELKSRNLSEKKTPSINIPLKFKTRASQDEKTQTENLQIKNHRLIHSATKTDCNSNFSSTKSDLIQRIERQREKG